MVPFGIHNPPLFYEDSIPALIYGGLGMMLGHEITHGFDADRIRYDSDGNYTVSIYHYLDEKFAIDQNGVLIDFKSHLFKHIYHYHSRIGGKIKH